MWIDKRSEFDSAKHLVAGTAYSNVYNLGGDRDLGPGNNPTLRIRLNTDALDGTTPTYNVTLQTAIDLSFTTPIDLATINIPKGSVAGTKFSLGFPFTNKQFLRLKYVLADGGATADVTLSADLSDEQMPSYQAYPQNINE